MRTTLDIDDQLLRQAKREAARTKRSLRAVVEDALRERFARRGKRKSHDHITLITSDQPPGLCPGVDLDRWVDLLDVMEAPDDPS